MRPYKQNEKSAVLELFRANAPDYFDPAEEGDLIAYLDHEREDYFVAEENVELIGAGGINYFPKERKARISWDFVKPQFHGKGVGRMLVEYRINHLKDQGEVDVVEVRTSQHAHKFYEKMGFQLVLVEKDFWAKNLDLYLMNMRIQGE
ncbi:MAG: GNAT family N-acetyltransferase [Cyclobacteriaceae bacterium]